MVKLIDKLKVEDRKIDRIKQLNVQRLDLEKYGVNKEEINRYGDF